MGCYTVATSDPLYPLFAMQATDIALLATTTLQAWLKKQI
jgi:hypothetical protein